MALLRKSGEIPLDAVRLTESEALQYKQKLVWNWKPESDVWPFRYGIGILGTMSGISGIYINNYYRKKLKLKNFGRLSSYAPIVILPAIISSLFHNQFVTTDILLRKDLCPVCIETRSVLIQTVFGVAYPALLGPAAGFMFANRYYTYNVPSLTSAPKDLFKLYQKFTQPLLTTLLVLLIGHVVVASLITAAEAKAEHKIHSIILKELYQTHDH